MKFKDSDDWRFCKFGVNGKSAIDFIGILLWTNEDDIEKIEINVYKNKNHEWEDWNDFQKHYFDNSTDACNFLYNKDLYDVVGIRICWRGDVSAYVSVGKDGVSTPNFHFPKKI